MTDTAGNLLSDCGGNPVTASGSDAGRFAIVINKKQNRIVATNPGGFYYNLVWTNGSGSDKSVQVDFVRSGLVPKGANAIHAIVFPPQFSGFDQAAFDAANEAVPGGADDHLDCILVQAGWTLVVTYHLDYAATGSAPPAGISDNCGTANQVVSVTATVTDCNNPDPATNKLGECTSGAKGYSKK
jgi:hypothetical protein